MRAYEVSVEHEVEGGEGSEGVAGRERRLDLRLVGGELVLLRARDHAQVPQQRPEV